MTWVLTDTYDDVGNERNESEQESFGALSMVGFPKRIANNIKETAFPNRYTPLC
jgi:hypothetical protein